VNHQATFLTYNLYLNISVMVIVASIYLRFYIEVWVRVGTFLPTPTPHKIPSYSDSNCTALLILRIISNSNICQLRCHVMTLHALTCDYLHIVTYYSLCLCICWDETKLHFLTERVWGLFLHHVTENWLLIVQAVASLLSQPSSGTW
jgi:hypothetical protein